MFKRDTSNLELARLQFEAIKAHAGKKIFIDPYETDTSIRRLELPLPTLNKILSGKYFGEHSGFAMGKLYSFVGMESTGKTALSLYIAGTIIKNGGVVAWLDKENSFDPEYAKNVFGIDIYDTEHFILLKPDNAEEAFDALQSLVDNQAVDLAVVDSIPALGASASNENDANSNSMATLARRIAEHIPRIINKCNEAGTSIIYINQLRANISGGMAYGKKQTGGNTMLFAPHCTLFFRRKEEVEKGTGDMAEFIGQEILIKAEKNKLAFPKQYGLFMLYPGEGFSRETDILNLALNTGVCKKSGSWYSFGEERIGQGIDTVRGILKENHELTDKIWDKTKLALNPVFDITTGEIIEEESKSTKKGKKTLAA